MLEDITLQFHVRRSKVLDALGLLECAIQSLLARNGSKLACETLGLKVEKARKLKASPQLSKACLTKLGPLLDQCEAIIALRNDIVHSRMQIVTVDGEKCACFVHNQQRASYGLFARILTTADFDRYGRGIATVAREIQHLAAKPVVSPASSPPPPAPGAAGGP